MLILFLSILAVVTAVMQWPQPEPTATATVPQTASPPQPVTAPPPLRAAQPARPDHIERVFEVPAFGRYAVRVVSPFGTALRLVDSMAGPGPEDGIAGKRDGRLDGFLDPGAHKAVMTLPDKTDGLVDLKVDGFVERNEAPLALRDLTPLSTELQDLEQRSYWIDVPVRRTVFIEAAGRKLADLRLWRDGTWLVDAEPLAGQIQSRPGRPLQLLRLALTLEPGFYRLTAYGGPGLPWTEDGAENPLHLRMGIPILDVGTRRSLVAGPFGLDRWLIPKGATSFRLELPEAGKAAMDVTANFSGTTIGASERVSIDKTARSQAGELSAITSADHTLVSIERNAGEPYVLQSFNTARTRLFQATGWHALSVTSAATGDDVDLGAILVETTPGNDKVIASSTLRLTAETGWMRRFNLLGPVTMFVEVVSPGRYTVRAENLDTEITVEPFFKGANYKPRPSRFGGGEWDLDAGFQVITVAPRAESRGIVTLSIQGAQGTIPTQPSPAVTAIDFAKIWLDSKRPYRLTLNQTGTASGAQLRECQPVNLAAGDLTIILQPGESREVSVRVPAPGTLALVAENGSSLPLVLNNGAPAPTPAVSAGLHTAVLANAGATPLRADLRFSAQPAAISPPPPANLTRLPNFPVLTADAPHFLNLGRNQSATFALKVDKPALYRVESTGLLQTAGNVRTQVRPSLARATANGIGRNFLLQQYLRPGLYQLTVSTLDQSMGHLGVTLTASDLRPGGALSWGNPARATLAAGEGIGYDLTVAERGTYRLQALTLAGPTQLRLEDSEGWPLTNPGRTGTLTRELEPGHYRLVVLPQPLPARVVTLVERIAEPVARQGHGPHPLPLGESVSHRWEEPPAGGERIADAWDFTLPADADMTITLGDGMEGRLEGRDGARVAEFNHLRPLARRLAAGPYRLSMRSIQPNNRLDYTVATHITQLIAGTQRRISPPATIPVAVGASGLVDITSFGDQDMRATLRDSSGMVVAYADDRADDWNFAIATRLPPGDYRLEVRPVGSYTTDTLIRMRAQEEVEDPALAAESERVLADGAMHIMALDPAETDGLMVVSAHSADEIGLALEREATPGQWRVMGTATGRTPRLAMARTAGRTDHLRLRAWSLDHTTTPLAVTAHRLTPAAQSESQLAKGLRLEPLGGLEPPVGFAAVKLDHPGLLQLETPPLGLAWSAAANTRVLNIAEGILSSRDGMLWFLGEAGATVTARRVAPPAEGVLALTLPDGEDAAVPVEPGPVGERRGPQLWLAESRIGQPGIAPVGGDPRASGWAEGEAVAALTDAHAAKGKIMRLWRADGAGALPLTLRRVAFPAPTRSEMLPGLSDGAVAAGTALSFTLPPGPKRLRLTLPPATAVVLTEDGQIGATLWAGATGRSVTLDSKADGLMLLNTGAEGRYAVDLSPAVAEQTALTRHTLTSRWLPTEGELRLDVTADKPVIVQLSGAVLAARAVQGDGKVVDGTRLAITGNSTLTVRHPAGLLAIWSDGDDAQSWPAADKAVPPPPVPGAVTLTDSPLWRMTSAEPVLLHLATSNPVALGQRRLDAPPEIKAWPSGASAHLFLPRGVTVIGLKPLQDGPLSGTARLTTSAPVAIDEGLGAKIRLAPGDARLFAFTLTQAGPIGIGVRAGADTARARLMDETGKVLAEGAVTMTELAAGRYYLQVENRADAAAVEVQPALVGVARPDTGPPEDVKRRYWQMVSDEQEVR